MDEKEKNVYQYIKRKVINARFSCNEYYLMGKLLTDSYKIRDILSKDFPNLDKMSEDEKDTLLKQFDEFMHIAKDMSCISHLLNFGTNFDLLSDEEKGKYNDKIFDELARNDGSSE